MAVRTTLFIIASFALVLVAACGSGRSGPSDAGRRTDLGPAHDSGPPTTDLGVMHDAGTMPPTDMGMMTMVDLGHTMTGDAGMCIASCVVDFDCSRTCPASAGHAQCCDRSTHHCFPTSGSMCPAPTDAGTDASMY